MKTGIHSTETLKDDDIFLSDSDEAAVSHANKELYDRFIWNIENKRPHKALELLQNNPALNSLVAAQNNRALRSASRLGYHLVVEALLSITDVTKNITANANEAFRLAAQHGHLNIVNRLLQSKDVEMLASISNNYAFVEAATGGFLDVMKRLLEIPHVRSDITAQNNAAFRHAAIAGQLSVVEFLLAYPEVSRSADIFDNSALKIASQHAAHYDVATSYSEIARLLFQLPNVKASLIADSKQIINNLPLQRMRDYLLNEMSQTETVAASSSSSSAEVLETCKETAKQDEALHRPAKTSRLWSFISCLSRRRPLIDDIAPQRLSAVHASDDAPVYAGQASRPDAKRQRT